MYARKPPFVDVAGRLARSGWSPITKVKRKVHVDELVWHCSVGAKTR
jgi:hypothetical protein